MSQLSNQWTKTVSHGLIWTSNALGISDFEQKASWSVHCPSADENRETGVRLGYALSCRAAQKKKEGSTFVYMFNLELPIYNGSSNPRKKPPVLSITACLSVYLSIYLPLFLSLKLLPEVHLSFHGFWLEFNEVPVTAHRKKNPKQTKTQKSRKNSHRYIME